MAPPPAASGLSSWSWTGLGHRLGVQGMDTVFVDGEPRLLVGFNRPGGFGNNSAFAALADDGAGGLVHRRASHDLDASGAARIASGQVLAGPDEQIVVMLRAGDVRILDAADGTTIGTFSTGLIPDNGVVVDLDGDGLDEIVLTDAVTGDAVAFDRFGTTLGTFANGGGDFLAVGQADADPAFELATSDGYIIDMGTGLTQATFSAALADTGLAMADTDLDGVAELYALAEWGGVTSIDPVTGGTVWSSHPGFDYRDLVVADADNDGVSEVVVGTRQGDPGAYGLNPANGGVLWSAFAPSGYHSASAYLTVDDLDLDGDNEVWMATGSWSGYPRVMRMDVASGTTTYVRPARMGAYVGPALGDVDGAGAPDLAIVARIAETPGSGLIDAGLLVFSGADREPIAPAARLFDGLVFDEVVDVDAADIDGDGLDELLVTGDRVRDGGIEVFEMSGGVLTRVFQHLRASSDQVGGAAADIDGDGIADVIYASDLGLEGLDATGTVFWSDSTLDIVDLLAADVDNDGDDDLAVLTSTALAVLDLQTPTVLTSVAVAADDLRVDTQVTPPALLVGMHATGDVEAYRDLGAGLTLVGASAIPGGFDAFDVAGPTSFALCQGGEWLLFDWASSVETWRSQDYRCHERSRMVNYMGTGRTATSLGFFGFGP